MEGSQCQTKKYKLMCHSMSSMVDSKCQTKKHIHMYQWGGLWCFLPLLRHFNPAEPVVEKSVILSRIKMSHAFPRVLATELCRGLPKDLKFVLNNGRKENLY